MNTYKFEHTAQKVWYVESKVFGNTMGPFKTKKAAYAYAVEIDKKTAE